MGTKLDVEGFIKRSVLIAGIGFLVIAFGEFLYRELVVRPEAERIFVEHFDLKNLVDSLDKPRKFSFAYYPDTWLMACPSCSSARVFEQTDHVYTSLRVNRKGLYYEVFQECPEGKTCIPFEGRVPFGNVVSVAPDLKLVAVPESLVSKVLNTEEVTDSCIKTNIMFYAANLCRFDRFFAGTNYQSGFSLKLEFPRTALLDRCCGQGAMQLATKGLAIDWVGGVAWTGSIWPTDNNVIRSDEL